MRGLLKFVFPTWEYLLVFIGTLIVTFLAALAWGFHPVVGVAVWILFFWFFNGFFIRDILRGTDTPWVDTDDES